jgi:pyruvate dehydrogenase E2 component (dihydrolipoamide acetyltransferase)
MAEVGHAFFEQHRPARARTLAQLSPTPHAAQVTEILMPALSSTMTEGKISEWLVNEGDKVEVGDILLVVESDKADMDVESFEEGYVAKILTPEGESVTVGGTMALLASTESEIAAVAAAGAGGTPAGAAPAQAATPAQAAAPVAAAPVAAAAPAAATPVGGRVVASPFAKKLAEEKGVDLSAVVGTGPGGRIVASDVEGAAAGGTAPAPAYVGAAGTATPAAKKLAKSKGVALEGLRGTGNFGRITPDDVLIAAGEPPKKAIAAPASPAASTAGKAAAPAAAAAAAPAAPAAAPSGVVAMSAMQKAVVKNMAWASDVPTYQVSRAITTDELDQLYKQVKGKGVTMSALLAKAAGMALAKHPIMNANYVPDGIQYNSNINVAMAVAMPDGGLITPVLSNADSTDLYTLSRSWKDLVPRALEGKLSPDEYSTGTFTISNLGMFGVSSFVSILPPGQGAIMAVAASTPTAVLQKNGMMGMVKQMTVTLTCDHRHIYGADAAKFLVDFADIIENETISLLM